MRRGLDILLVVLLLGQGTPAHALGSGNRIVSRQYLDSAGTASRTTTTYYDGLGRERLRVTHSTDDDAVAMRTDYDARGNVDKQWLAVPGGAELLTSAAFDAAVAGYYGREEIAYKKYTYDETGANRVIGEDGPGRLWHNHGTHHTWHKNEQSGEYSCIKLTIDAAGQMTAAGRYGAGTLTVTETTDGDGIRTLTFTNRGGKTVLVRRIGNSGTTADTRYVYDARSDLRCTLSPEGSRLLPENGTVDADVIDNHGQRYDYDIWHRCVSAKAPGCGATHYVYNRMNAVCFESTAEQRTRGEWTLTKYDCKHRPAVRGTVIIAGATRETLQTHYGDSLMQETLLPTINNAEGRLMYSEDSGPRGYTPYMAWYYDNYDFMIGVGDSIKTKFDTHETDGYTQKTMCTGMSQVDGEGTTWYTATKYDRHGQPLMQCRWDTYRQKRRLTTTMTYDFVGNETARVEKIEELTETIPTETHTAQTTTAYDNMGRPVEITVRIDDNPETIVSRPAYDAIGRLTSDNNAAINITYDYDIRSHLTGITTERFMQRAWYGSMPNESTTPTTTTPAPTINYAGINAQRTAWSDGQDASGLYTKTETYTYDDLGRYASSQTEDGEILENITTDLDANVLTIVRHYNGDIVQDAAIMYDGGKATNVEDYSTPYWLDAVGRFPAGSYTLTYDNDGRLTADETRGVTHITYHPYGNLPKNIKMSNGDEMRSTYLPDGTLTKRMFTTNIIKTITKITADGDTIIRQVSRPTTAIREYAGGFEHTPEGWIYHTIAGHYDLRAGKHYWYLRDRLGSTAAVIDEDANIVQTTAYYPSGTPYSLPNTTLATKTDAKTDKLHIGNRWLSHSGLNYYDNTARLHDPLLMHYTTADPLSGNYPENSPWSHCSANPLNLIDLTGMAEIYVCKGDELQKVGSSGVDDGVVAVVDKQLGKQIQALTEQGEYYTDIQNTEHMAIVPTFKDFITILKSLKTANELQVETGASKDADGNIHIWDNGGKLNFDADGVPKNQQIKAFNLNGESLPKRKYSQWYYHVHPKIRYLNQMGKSEPSDTDKVYDADIMRKKGYKGATFVIGGKDEKITFYYGMTIIFTAKIKNLIKVIPQDK